jgi:hypothetical protein
MKVLERGPTRMPKAGVFVSQKSERRSALRARIERSVKRVWGTIGAQQSGALWGDAVSYHTQELIEIKEKFVVDEMV